jgi:hypothetical protein
MAVAFQSSLEAIGPHAFASCTRLSDIVFEAPISLRTIDTGAFSSSAIARLAIPSGVEMIGAFGFQRCRTLKEVVFADGSKLKEIGQFAFRESAVREMRIPRSVARIGSGCFQKCAALAEATFEHGLAHTEIADKVFEESGIVRIAIPRSVQAVRSAAFGNCEGLLSIELDPQSGVQSRLVITPDIPLLPCPVLPRFPQNAFRRPFVPGTDPSSHNVIPDIHTSHFTVRRTPPQKLQHSHQ